MKPERRIGQKAYCRKGILGTVTKVRYDKQGRPVFIGFTTRKRPWQSVQPAWAQQ